MASDIINKLLIYSKLNAKSFSEKIGLERPQAIYDILKGKTKSISLTMQDKILSVFPELNRTWLMTGEGEMLKNCNKSEKDEQNLNVSDMYREICRLNKIVEKQQDTITEQMSLISEQSKTINRLVFQRQDGTVANRTA